ncbi:hypothetical protein FACS1894137_10360 [Spirochaetia bacterium]|nr:hypothetical protein FACS1894137_10360 [Spirochaetia bacterium]
MYNLTNQPIRDILRKLTPNILKVYYRKLRYLSRLKKSVKEIFTEIKEKNLWGSPKSVSGPGSEAKQIEKLIIDLSNLFKIKDIKSILDIPCGDFNWMKEVDLSGIEYIGADIVDGLINENIRKYENKNIEFKVLDIITDKLPTVDLIFVRDCFVHLSYKNIFHAINNIKLSGCKYLLTTTFTNRHNNYDIITGDWRPLNLCDKPFKFPEPEYVIVENCSELGGIFQDKSMGLWCIDKL